MTDLSCKPCKGTGDELEDSMSALGIPGGMVAVAPCPDCGGSGIAAWAVEAGAKAAYGAYANFGLTSPVDVDRDWANAKIRSEWISIAKAGLTAVREEAKKR